MPCWYYDKKDLKNTPSIRGGMDFETERQYRKEGVCLIMSCGTAMSLGYNTVATGAVYFHRFYMFHTFQEFPRYVTACCCLFLAGKVEETPKKCRDIITTARSMVADAAFQAFSEDARKAKEEVMTLESILLQTIKFDLEVHHPYNFLTSYVKSLKGDKVRIQKMLQMAWTFVNDSLSTTVCLQWEPEIIAVALIHLASKLCKFAATDWTGRQPSHLRWWDMFISDVTMEILEDICHQVLDLYPQPGNKQQNTSQNSPPMSTNNNTTKDNSPPVAQTKQLPKSRTEIEVTESIAGHDAGLRLPNAPLPTDSVASGSTPPIPQMPTPARLPTTDMNATPMTLPSENYQYTYQPTYVAMYPAPPPPPPPPTMPMHSYPAHAFHQQAMMPAANVPPNIYYNHPPPNRIPGFYPTAP